MAPGWLSEKTSYPNGNLRLHRKHSRNLLHLQKKRLKTKFLLQLWSYDLESQLMHFITGYCVQVSATVAIALFATGASTQDSDCVSERDEFQSIYQHQISTGLPSSPPTKHRISLSPGTRNPRGMFSMTKTRTRLWVRFLHAFFTKVINSMPQHFEMSVHLP